MNLQDMSIQELRDYRKDIQYDELWAARDAGDQQKLAAAQRKMDEIDRVLKAKMDERFWQHQQRDTSKGF